MRHLMFNPGKWKTLFFTIWGGQIFSVFGSILVDFVLVWYMTETTGSAVVLATGTLVVMIPNLILNPIIGTLVDRWNRRILMILADGIVAAATLVLVLLFASGNVQIWQIYILLFVRGVFGNIHFVSMQSATSLMVPKEQLSRIAGMNQTLKGILNILGPPIGAFLLGLLPIGHVLTIDVISAAFAIVPLLFIIIPEPEKGAGTETKKVSFSVLFGDLKEAFHYLLKRPGFIALFLLLMLLNFFSTPAFTLIPLMISQYFHGGAIEYGFVGPAIGAGFILGGLCLSIWGGFKKRIHTFMLGAVFIGVFIFLFAIVPDNSLWAGLVCLFLIAFFIPFTNSMVSAITQANISPEMQGRVISMRMTCSNLVAPFGLIAAGPLTEFMGLQLWYWIGGGAVILVSLIALRIKSLMNIEGEQLQPVLEGSPGK